MGYGLDEYHDYEEEDTGIRCNKCGKDGFHWENNALSKFRYRLFDGEELHICATPAKPKGGSR